MTRHLRESDVSTMNKRSVDRPSFVHIVYGFWVVFIIKVVIILPTTGRSIPSCFLPTLHPDVHQLSNLPNEDGILLKKLRHQPLLNVNPFNMSLLLTYDLTMESTSRRVSPDQVTLHKGGVLTICFLHPERGMVLDQDLGHV